MEVKFIKSLESTLADFESGKVGLKTEFTEEQLKILEPLTFGYTKALKLLKEYSERQTNTLSDARGYQGSVAFNTDTKEYYGRIKGMSDELSYTGGTMPELAGNFHKAVDDYLQSCREIGKEPEK